MVRSLGRIMICPPSHYKVIHTRFQIHISHSANMNESEEMRECPCCERPTPEEELRYQGICYYCLDGDDKNMHRYNYEEYPL